VKIKNVVVVYLVQKCFPKNLKEGDCVTRTEEARRRRKITRSHKIIFI
jgi:hypothetical protein